MGFKVAFTRSIKSQQPPWFVYLCSKRTSINPSWGSEEGSSVNWRSGSSALKGLPLFFPFLPLNKQIEHRSPAIDQFSWHHPIPTAREKRKYYQMWPGAPDEATQKLRGELGSSSHIAIRGSTPQSSREIPRGAHGQICLHWRIVSSLCQSLQASVWLVKGLFCFCVGKIWCVMSGQRKICHVVKH